MDHPCLFFEWCTYTSCVVRQNKKYHWQIASLLLMYKKMEWGWLGIGYVYFLSVIHNFWKHGKAHFHAHIRQKIITQKHVYANADKRQKRASSITLGQQTETEEPHPLLNITNDDSSIFMLIWTITENFMLYWIFFLYI